jgi:hypothetical protein
MSRNSSTTVEQRKAFSVALEAAMQSAGIRSAADLYRRGSAAGIDRTADTFNKWFRGESEIAVPHVLILEQICGVEPGHLSRHLGWVPVGVSEQTTIEQLILVDRNLTDANKATLLGLLEQLRRVQ